MLLLDTHIWLWWINGTDSKLSGNIVKMIEIEDDVCVSAISCFEMEWLVRHDRIRIDIPLDDWFAGALSDAGVICLPVTKEIARRAAALIEHHKDPQDRIIIATSIEHQCRIVSADAQFERYGEILSMLVKP